MSRNFYNITFSTVDGGMVFNSTPSNAKYDNTVQLLTGMEPWVISFLNKVSLSSTSVSTVSSAVDGI